MWVGVGGTVAGALRCEDSMRTTAPGAVAKLRALGTDIVMLTGDNEVGSHRRSGAASSNALRTFAS